MTLVFSPAQAILPAKNNSLFVSPFIGWKEANGEDCKAYIQAISDIYDNYGYKGKTQIICAAIRTPKQIVDCAVAGADIVTVHYEACEDLQATIDKIHAAGAKVGISIKPKTPVEVLLPYLDQAEMFLIMSVEPGFGGQAFIPESLDKIKELRNLLNARGIQADIEVDGGIYHSNVKEVLNAGANVIVAGSAVFKGNVAENVKGFMEILSANE